MNADRLLERYKKELVRATNYLKNNPNGIITSSALLVKNNDEVFMLMDGYDNKYKFLNSKHLLIWKLIERYSLAGFKKFNLGGITNPTLENNHYKGLNNFKTGFDAKVIEYIGDLELITNSALYFMYRNSFEIKNILKK
jgi:peptidoglycan pentaglycine glycine transferase (the second and third glycine)